MRKQLSSTEEMMHTHSAEKSLEKEIKEMQHARQEEVVIEKVLENYKAIKDELSAINCKWQTLKRKNVAQIGKPKKVRIGT